ncbi:MAG: hypothetical protein MI861_10300 [Pirellulales bacterium]|nr:hypothetical protein [Pirellulales bacterium]
MADDPCAGESAAYAQAVQRTLDKSQAADDAYNDWQQCLQQGGTCGGEASAYAQSVIALQSAQQAESDAYDNMVDCQNGGSSYLVPTLETLGPSVLIQD